jgi:hypothetical protein
VSSSSNARAGAAVVEFVDAAATNFPARFYRARMER